MDLLKLFDEWFLLDKNLLRVSMRIKDNFIFIGEKKYLWEDSGNIYDGNKLFANISLYNAKTLIYHEHSTGYCTLIY